MNIIRKKIPARVGSMSCVGVGKERPCHWGNYFDFFASNEDFILGREIRCVNMWAENLQELVRNGTLSDGKVEVVIFECEYEYDDKKYTSKFAVVDDSRISEEWYYNKFCFTGGLQPSGEVAKEMYSIHGDPDNELEKFTDPVSYYAKRGSEYDPKTGIIRTKISAPSRTSDATYSLQGTEILVMKPENKTVFTWPTSNVTIKHNS
jgi:hypothetical protein